MTLVEKKNGGKVPGTWVHPRIALDIARWVSAKLAVKMNDWLIQFLTGDLSLAENIIQKHDEINDTNTQFTSRSDINTGNRITFVDTVSNEVLKANPKKASVRQKSYKRLELKYKMSVADHKDTKLQLNEAITTVFDQADQIDELMAKVDKQSADLQKLLGFATETKDEVAKVSKNLVEAKEEVVKVSKKSDMLKKDLNESKDEVIKVSRKADDLSKKLDKAIPNRVVYTEVPKNQLESAYVYKHINYSYGTDFEYHMFRCQEKSLQSCVRNRIQTLRKNQNNERGSVPVLEILNLNKYFENNPNSVIFWTRFSEYMERIGAIDLNHNNKMQFNMIVEEYDFREELYWFDLERGSDL